MPGKNLSGHQYDDSRLAERASVVKIYFTKTLRTVPLLLRMMLTPGCRSHAGQFECCEPQVGRALESRHEHARRNSPFTLRQNKVNNYYNTAEYFKGHYGDHSAAVGVYIKR